MMILAKIGLQVHAHGEIRLEARAGGQAQVAQPFLGLAAEHRGRQLSAYAGLDGRLRGVPHDVRTRGPPVPGIECGLQGLVNRFLLLHRGWSAILPGIWVTHSRT